MSVKLSSLNIIRQCYILTRFARNKQQTYSKRMGKTENTFVVLYEATVTCNQYEICLL